MVISDGAGLPLSVRIESGQRAEVSLVEDTLASRFTRKLPTRLIGDRAYDSNKLDDRLKKRGVELIAPNNPTHKKSQDGRQLRRYKRRWHVERLIAWLLRMRRVHTRYEVKPMNFLGFVQLACMKLLVRYL
jgi:transposase